MRAALDALPNGGATVDPTAPGKGPGDKDPNEPAFTVRVVVTDAAGNRGEDRKVLFDYRDSTLHQGFSKDLGSGGEASPRLFDLDGDNKLDTVQADSSGELRVFADDGTPIPTFNNGQPVRTGLYPNVHLGEDSFNTVDPPREVLRTPAIGDIDGDTGARDRRLGGRARVRLERRRLGRGRASRCASTRPSRGRRTARETTTSSAASPRRQRWAT